MSKSERTNKQEKRKKVGSEMLEEIYMKNQSKPSKQRKATEGALKEVADSKETAGKDTTGPRAHNRKSLIKAERKRLTDEIQNLPLP